MAVIPFVDTFNTQMPFPMQQREQVANIEARNAIPDNARWEGMPVYVINEQTVFYLKGGVTNADWKPLADGDVVVGVQTVYFNSSAPLPEQGADGDIWFRPNDTVIELYQKGSGSWTKLGEWDTGGGGGGVAVIRNDALAYGLTSATLNSDYPTIPVGGKVYSKTNGVSYIKLQDGDWEVNNMEIV